MCPLSLLSQYSWGWGWPDTLQGTDTRSPTETCCGSAGTNTSGASEIKHFHHKYIEHFKGTFLYYNNDETKQYRIKPTKDMKHNGSTALSYLVGGSADVLPIIGPCNRHYGQLAAVWVKLMMGGVKCHRPVKSQIQIILKVFIHKDAKNVWQLLQIWVDTCILSI